MKAPPKTDSPRPVLGIRFERPGRPAGGRMRREPDRLVVYLPDADEEIEGWLDDGLPLIEAPTPVVH